MAEQFHLKGQAEQEHSTRLVELSRSKVAVGHKSESSRAKQRESERKEAEWGRSKSSAEKQEHSREEKEHSSKSKWTEASRKEGQWRQLKSLAEQEEHSERKEEHRELKLEAGVEVEAKPSQWEYTKQVPRSHLEAQEWGESNQGTDEPPVAALMPGVPTGSSR